MMIWSWRIGQNLCVKRSHSRYIHTYMHAQRSVSACKHAAKIILGYAVISTSTGKYIVTAISTPVLKNTYQIFCYRSFRGRFDIRVTGPGKTIKETLRYGKHLMPPRLLTLACTLSQFIYVQWIVNPRIDSIFSVPAKNIPVAIYG